MNYKLIFSMVFLHYSFSAATQNNFDCIKTLALTSENILQIFKSLEDRSIRGKKPDDDYSIHRFSTICLEGQIDNGRTNTERDKFLDYSDVEFTILSTDSKEVSIKMYYSLKQLLQTIKPLNWYEKENVLEKGSRKNYGAGKYFVISDQKDDKNDNVIRTSRRLSMNYHQAVDKYKVEIHFQIWNVFGVEKTQEEAETFNRYFDILEGLKDGSIKGVRAVGNEWKSKISLVGEIRSYIQSEDYGKNRGLAAVTYIFFEGGNGKREEALKLYNELKQKIKMFKPEDWYSDESEPADNNTWRYWIQKSDAGFFIDVNLTNDNMVFMQFTSTWDKK